MSKVLSFVFFYLHEVVCNYSRVIVILATSLITFKQTLINNVKHYISFISHAHYVVSLSCVLYILFNNIKNTNII